MSNLKLDAFLNIPFGTPSEEVKNLLTARAGCVFDQENSNLDNLLFHGIKFAGRETLLISLLLFDGKFCKALVFIQPNLEAQTVSLYQEIKAEINDKYFVSKQDYETYTYPYEKNDGYTESAISTGKASFSCYWNFPNRSLVDNYIAIEINEHMNIIVSYEDGFLMDLLVQKTKANNSLDY